MKTRTRVKYLVIDIPVPAQGTGQPIKFSQKIDEDLLIVDGYSVTEESPPQGTLNYNTPVGGPFAPGTVITGVTSGATAIVILDHVPGFDIYATSGTFQIGETINGAIGQTAIVSAPGMRLINPVAPAPIGRLSLSFNSKASNPILMTVFTDNPRRKKRGYTFGRLIEPVKGGTYFEGYYIDQRPIIGVAVPMTVKVYLRGVQEVAETIIEEEKKEVSPEETPEEKTEA